MNENSASNPPIPARMMIISPAGILPRNEEVNGSEYVGTTKRSPGVNVGIRVGSGVVMNCAAKVGLIVAVIAGVGVDGGSTIGSSPGESTTTGE